MDSLDDLTLSQKLAFLMEVRSWITGTATTGHAYLPIDIRKDWLAWADKRITYLVKRLNEH
jgi:hypothetical protein